MKTKPSTQLRRNAYIILLFIRKIAFYIILSFLPNFLFYYSERLQMKRRQSSEEDMELFSLIFCIVFIIAFISLLYLTKKHIFNTGVTDCSKIKDQMKFEAFLAAGSISIYLIISVILAIIFVDKKIKISLYIPMYLFYKFLHNAWLSLLLAIVMYILFTFIVLVIPYIRRKRSALVNQGKRGCKKSLKKKKEQAQKIRACSFFVI